MPCMLEPAYLSVIRMLVHFSSCPLHVGSGPFVVLPPKKPIRLAESKSAQPACRGLSGSHEHRTLRAKHASVCLSVGVLQELYGLDATFHVHRLKKHIHS